jgi:DNA-binding beta-propeller fold protein YncE
MKSLKRIAIYATIPLLFIACKKNEVGPQHTEKEGVAAGLARGVFVVNEGNFGTNNGSISFFDFESQQIENRLFERANEGKRLGDVAQSITIIEDKAYVVVNNAQRIEVVDLPSFEHSAEIKGLKSPRYLLNIDGKKAYVSNFVLGDAENVIHIIDLGSNQLVGNIAINGWVESMRMVGGLVYVCNMQEDKVQVISPINDKMVTTIVVGEEPQSMVEDKEGFLWVLCTGGFSSTLPALYKIDPQSKQVVDKVEGFAINAYPTNLCIDATGGMLYYLSSDVFSLPIYDLVINTTPLISLDDLQNPYGLTISSDNRLFVTDAIDFQQDGRLYVYNSAAKLLNTYSVGEGPGSMLEYLPK